MRHFTLAEATEVLATVRPLAERMVEVSTALRASRSELADVQGRVAGNGHGQALAPRLRALKEGLAGSMEELRGIVERIHALGAQVKDADAGLVDFPALREGETVLLCWRVGEEAIGYWHGLAEGFAGRKSLRPDVVD